MARLALLLSAAVVAAACAAAPAAPVAPVATASPRPTPSLLSSPTPSLLPSPTPSPTPSLDTGISVPPGPEIRGVVSRRSAAGDVVALTFDDGTNARSIRELVAVAVATRTPITFFPTAGSLRAFPALWRAVAAAGFPIANHTRNHRFLAKLLAAEGPAPVLADIRGFAAAAEAIGVPYLSVLRPPYGDRNSAVDALAAEAGFPTVAVWDTSFADTAPTCSGSVAGHVRAAGKGRSGSIVLGHARPLLTPRILAAVIAAYRARGLEPVALPTLLTGTPVVIDWAKAAKATSAPERDGGPRVPTAAPTPYDPADRRPPGVVEGACPAP
jgi:peptidoglycan/xylan/chitin deacetylase (PgdA/CDA1 family)